MKNSFEIMRGGKYERFYLEFQKKNDLFRGFSQKICKKNPYALERNF